VAQLRIEIPAITLRIEHDKKIPIAVIVSIVLEIARMTLKQILEQINEILVEEYCGKKYERGKEFRRHSKKKRTISTLLGEVTLNLTRIKGKKTIIPSTMLLNSKAEENTSQTSKRSQLIQL